jgi:NAD(P) transhydrogenase
MKDVAVGTAAAALLSVLLVLPSHSFTLPSSPRAIHHSLSTTQSPPFQYASIEPQLFSTISDSQKEVGTATKKYDPSDDFTGKSPSKILGEKVPYSDITIGVLRETFPGENRVSIAPASAKMLVDAGMSVIVEKGGKSGHNIFFNE